MDARPYRLVSETRLQATRVQAEEQLSRWCRDWGVAPSRFQVRVTRFGAAEGDRAGAWSCGGDRRWIRSAPRAVLEAAFGAALFGATDAATGSLGRECVRASLEAYEPALADDSATVAQVPADGEEMVLIELRGDDTLVAVIQPANDTSSAAAVQRASLPALSGADLDAALRLVPARPCVELGHTELALAELLELKTGQVVVLEQSIHQPVRLTCAGSSAEVFAHLGRAADRFAVQVMRPSKNKEIHMNKDVPGSGPAAKSIPGGHVQMVDLEELAGQPAGDTPVLDNRLSLFGGIKARVTAVVGHAQSSVGDLLALKEGATFKLDRHVDAPIDLIVEGRVIARGQLSVLDDQFAVRVTEVIQAGAK